MIQSTLDAAHSMANVTSTNVVDLEAGLGISKKANLSIWKARFGTVLSWMQELACVMLMYLFSELVIWGISRILSLKQVQFLSSIIGMVLVFTVMTLLYLKWNRTDELYNKHLMSKVNTINSHIGIGFPVPLIMLDPSNALSQREIGLVIANFCVTNVVSWIVCFLTSFAIVLGVFRFKSSKTSEPSVTRPHNLASANISSRPEIGWESESTRIGGSSVPDNKSSPAQSQRTSVEVIVAESEKSSGPVSGSAPSKLTFWYAVPLAAFFLVMVGVPVFVTTNDGRILDGCVLWFIWILCIKVQRWFKMSKSIARLPLLADSPRSQGAIATMMNPVLWTTLLMTGYIRIKASAMGGDIARVLANFSRGKPLYAIWTSAVSNHSPAKTPDHYFGAGDFALSILEFGIFIWGFKLYECRRQLWSISGLLTVFVSITAAAGNVFLSVLFGSLIGLLTPEALAFAARSTTLALSKPAIEAVGGNTAVNAALVVSNGIMGQLLYPFVLDKMGIKSDNIQKTDKSPNTEEEKVVVEDEPATIAAGIAIGINGAVMGVAYLYETKSRAAPYAVLAMTIYGVFTVIFTTVGPFKDLLLGLAQS